MGTDAPKLDLQGLGADALKMIDDDSTKSTPSNEAIEPITTDDDQTATSTATKEPLAQAQKEQTYEVDLGNGKIQRLTAAEIKDAYLSGLRQQDYTRKTQELSQQREQLQQVARQVEERYQQAETARQLLNNPQALLEYAQRQLQAQQPQTPLDPNAPVTVAQTRQLVEALTNKLTQLEQAASTNAQSLMQQAQQAVENKLEIARYAETIQGTLGQIYKDHPILTVRPEFEDIIRYNVAKLQPQTIEETVEAFKTVSGELAKQIDSSASKTQQQQKIVKDKLSKQGIEPPGGAAVQPTKPDFFKKGTGKRDLNWDSLKEATRSLANS